MKTIGQLIRELVIKTIKKVLQESSDSEEAIKKFDKLGFHSACTSAKCHPGKKTACVSYCDENYTAEIQDESLN